MSERSERNVTVQGPPRSGGSFTGALVRGSGGERDRMVHQ
jgi:hypothetical protein